LTHAGEDKQLIEAKLEEIRRRLLDLTRNNRLLNHRCAGQRTLQIFDEIPREVWRILVDEVKVMQFLAREEAPAEIRNALPAEEAGASRSPEALAERIAATDSMPRATLPATPKAPAEHPVMPLLPLAAVGGNGAAGERHRDHNLQTLLSGQKLQTRLVHLAREANSALQEQGCNILYLTLGIVQWADSEDSSETSRAPLIFVPIELKRKTVNTRYAVHLFDDDILVNPSLNELCKTQFKFELPAFDAEKDSIEEYFSKILQAISGMKGWGFLSEVHIGLFSFSKLLMYRDLDPQNWPDAAKLTSHPLIQQLTGIETQDASDAREIPDPATLDQAMKPADCFQIVDADSSQQAAILAARQGMSMVIDGPPGTGKSQTITNIIAESLAAGKTVLFVSEKAAALEVVQRRLQQTGLGDFALELHSRQASKKTVLEEINRTLELQKEAARVAMQPAEELLRIRDSLNTYRQELHEPLGNLKVSPFEAMSRASGLASEPEVTCEIPEVMSWSPEQLAESDRQLAALDSRLARVGDPAQHPWRGVGLKTVGLSQKQRIAKACEDLILSIGQLLQSAGSVATWLGLAAPIDVKVATDHLTVARVLLEAPPGLANCVQDDRWNPPATGLFSFLSLGQLRAKLKPAWQNLARPEAELEQWDAVVARLRLHGPVIFRLLHPSWYRDRKRIKSYMIESHLPAISKQVELLTVLTQSGQLRKQIEAQVPKFSAQFGAAWQGLDSDWTGLEKLARTAVAVRQVVLAGRISAASAAKFIEQQDRSRAVVDINASQVALTRLEGAWREWLLAIASDEKQWPGTDWQTTELSSVARRLAELPNQMEKIDDWVDLQQSIGECVNSPLSMYVSWALGTSGAAVRGRLASAFKRHFYRLWVEEALGRRESLRAFRGQDHQAVIRKFQELDQQWLALTRNRVASMLAAKRPSASQTAHRQSKLGLLQAEIRKKTRHMPLRKLLAAAGEVVQSIKPCFMMSPLSVAQYLAPGSMEFDVVIFDEASQVEPADAYGAVARANQLLLVGDEKQLPPTNFFDRVDPQEEDSDELADVHSQDLESILSLGIVRLRHRCGLRWHYRSRHSSLIEFSNEKFYDGALRVFPSPHTDCSELGLTFRHVESAMYMRGAGRFNPVEARTVAAAVIQHALEHPELSLGVGTLNQPQQRAIEDEIERLRRSNNDPRIEQFFAAHAARDPFFVKNLENIQGDERDVIFLSVGFGKDQNGRLHVNFGALNSDGGWRRLNVLITRARRRCVVFSSIRSDEIDLGATQARGVVALKEYLYAAEHGRLKDAFVPGGDHESEFEASVCRALRSHGWEVHAQVGCAGFAIDLAVVDPRSPGRYLLGIECDGATYHSSPTARDRDRLRQEVLEDLQWNIYRIWSTDWFKRPVAVLEALLKHLDALKQQSAILSKTADESRHQSASVAPPEPNEVIRQTIIQPKEELPQGVVPYEHHRDAPMLGTSETLLAMPTIRLAEVIRKIIQTEGPIHVDQAMHACAERFATKASARPREAFDRAVTYGIAINWISRRGQFLWDADASEAVVRHRANGCPVTDPDEIAPEEFEAAVRLILKQQFGLKLDAISEAVAGLMGFSRSGPKLKAAIEQSLIRLDERGEIITDHSGFVTLSQEEKLATDIKADGHR
jgi:very-short-patch-repair endonuclease